MSKTPDRIDGPRRFLLFNYYGLFYSLFISVGNSERTATVDRWRTQQCRITIEAINIVLKSEQDGRVTK